MKYRQIITFMLLGLFLNGCSTYRNYERPVDIRRLIWRGNDGQRFAGEFIVARPIYRFSAASVD